MQTLKSVEESTATGKSKELLDFVRQRSNRIPNMVRILANSPAALNAYLNLARALSEASLSANVRDLIAVAVAERIGCDYSLSAVSAAARNNGCSDDELDAARDAESTDGKTAAALRFAVKIVDLRGHVPPEDVRVLLAAGFSDAEVAEIVAAVILTTYRSYFNIIAQPEIDFPIVRTRSLSQSKALAAYSDRAG